MILLLNLPKLPSSWQLDLSQNMGPAKSMVSCVSEGQGGPVTAWRSLEFVEGVSDSAVTVEGGPQALALRG